MKKSLVDLVEIYENNENCVVMKVKEGTEMDLICLGCFDGTEKMFRLTKGADNTCTVWNAKGSYSWSWGSSGTTLVSDSMRMQGRMIEDCIVKDFEIYTGANKDLIKSSLRIKSLDDLKGLAHQFKLMGTDNNKLCVHRDGEFYSHMSIQEFDSMVDSKNYHITSIENYTSNNGCPVKVVKVLHP